MSEDAPMYFDDETSVLEVLISVQADGEVSHIFQASGNLVVFFTVCL